MNNAAVKIEKEFKELLVNLKARDVTAMSLRGDPAYYNNVAEVMYLFVMKVALCARRNRSLINAIGDDIAAIGDEVTFHILRRLDAILACEYNYMVPYVIRLVNNKVLSIHRRKCAELGKHHKISDDSDHTDAQDAECDSRLVSLDDLAWSMIPSEIDIEGDVLSQADNDKNRARAAKAFSCSKRFTRFEMVCFLVTKVLTNSNGVCTRNRVLSAAIDTFGLIPVSVACFKAAAAVFQVPYENFIVFKEDQLPEYDSIVDLCDKVSKASNSCELKLRRVLVKNDMELQERLAKNLEKKRKN